MERDQIGDSALRLRRAAALLSRLRVGDDVELVASIGILAGALYGLERAIELEYSDQRNSLGVERLSIEFARVTSQLAAGEQVEPEWLGGFFFTSALFRLAAFSDRLDKMVRPERYLAAPIRQVINWIKHHPDAHVRGNWSVTILQAIEAAELFCAELQALVLKRDDA